MNHRGGAGRRSGKIIRISSISFVPKFAAFQASFSILKRLSFKKNISFFNKFFKNIFKHYPFFVHILG